MPLLRYHRFSCHSYSTIYAHMKFILVDAEAKKLNCPACEVDIRIIVFYTNTSNTQLVTEQRQQKS